MPIDPSQFLSPGSQATDAFGLETPEGALARVRTRMAQRRADFFASNASANHGRQVGQSLADIFGAPVRKALDTSVARKAEQSRLMAAGMDQKTAKATAKLEVTPMFAEERRARKMQEIGGQSQGMIDDLVEKGVPAARAQAVGMFSMARTLEAKGFRAEATQMRLQASEQLQAQEEREANLAKVRATTASAEASAESTITTMESDDDTYIRFSEDGTKIQDMRSVALTDSEHRQALRDQGYINVGNNALTVGLDSDVLTGVKPVPQNVQENILAGMSMMSGLNVLEGVRDQTGIIEGPARAIAAHFGLAEGDLINAIAVKDKMKADIQSLIKGIPSNYDAALFEKMIPDPSKSQSTELYDSRVALLRDETERMVQLAVAFHKGTDKPVPEDVILAAQNMGIDVRGIDGMSREEYIRADAAQWAIIDEKIKRLEEMQGTPDGGETNTVRESLMDRVNRQLNEE